MKKKRLLKFGGLLKSPQWLIMKLSFIFMILFTFELSANVYSQRGNVSIRLDNVTMDEFINVVKQQTGINFLYNASLFHNTDRVSVDAQNESLDVVLKEVLEKKGFVYDFQNDVVVIRKGNGVLQPQQLEKKTVKGIVVDEEGVTLPGVSVLVKGTQSGVSTDIDGKFEVKIDNNPNAILVFSFVGMKNKEVKVGTSNDLKITLESDVTALDEVVVTGYQTISKERATGSFAVVTADDYKGKMETDIMSRVEGTVSGLVNYDNQVSIRGISTVYGNKSPLYVVDGMPYEGKIEAINPSDVENITVLKDATAASIYGARAANGVIVITTKKGKDGKTKISYNGSVKFKPLPDLGYLKLMNSSELVDIQVEGFNYYHTPYNQLEDKYALDEVTELLYQGEQGMIAPDQMEAGLNRYRSLNNKDQVKDAFLRTAITHQHNLSMSGGTDKHNYLVSVNYIGNNPYEKHRSDEQIGFNLKENVKFFSWLTADFGVSGNFVNNSGKNGLDNVDNMGRRTSTETSLYTGGTSYLMLKDENGNSNVWRQQKSDSELARLKAMGLRDEIYRPLDEIGGMNYEDKSAYYRVQAAFNIKLMEGLTVDLKYQNENTKIKKRQLFDKDSYYVRNMINDAASLNLKTGELELNVPSGGQLQQSEEELYSYTMRAQLNFNRTFAEKHSVTALLGTERRLIRDQVTSVYKMGYDDNSLGFKPIDPMTLISIDNTESLSGFFGWDEAEYNYFTHDEDRYVSFYGIASYTYNDRYSLNGSIRIDQSNLFGTDPKYQYRPLWSVGASWFMAEENFMKELTWLNRLNVRLTYGISGNVSKESGPYLTVVDYGYNNWTDDMSANIKNPPNPELRWEKTAVTNIGIDFAVLNSRLGGSIDYYNRKTTDILGNRESDPTLGWGTLLVNYGELSNRGIEVSLNSVNVRTADFKWSSNLNFSYNKNKIKKMTNASTSVFSFVKGKVNTEGQAMYSLFSYRYAGLNPENGSPLVYDVDGSKKSNVNSLDALEYSGTTRPPYNASFTNRFEYKGISLSLMFIYNGGHVMRDAVSPYLTSAPSSNIVRSAANRWRNPGDENISGIAPAMNESLYYTNAQTWYAANAHIIKGDYIKLRDVTLSYDIPKSLIRRFRLESASVNCQVSNPWYWAANDSGIDPEAYTTTGYGWGARTLPVPTTYTLGLSVNF